MKYYNLEKNSFFYEKKDKSQIGIFPRFSKKYQENVQVQFNLPHPDNSNAGAFGFCQPAQKSYRSNKAESLPIITKSGKKRGCKIYTRQDGMSEATFKEKINTYYETHRHFSRAASSSPLFYTKDGILYGLIHTYYVNGVNLFDYLDNNNELSFLEKSLLCQLILSELENNFHAIKIEHNDLKLENIIFDEKANILSIIDLDSCIKFGAEKIAQGTHGYRPNDEKLSKELRELGYNDIFAVGMIIMDILLKEKDKPTSVICMYDAEVMDNLYNEIRVLLGKKIKYSPDEHETACELVYEWLPKFEQQLAADSLPEEIRIKAQESFESQWQAEYPDFPDSSKLYTVVADVFETSFLTLKQAYTSQSYYFHEKCYSIPAYSHFAITELKTFLTHVNISIEHRHQLIDVIVRSQLAEPEIVPTLKELLNIFQQLARPVFAKNTSNPELADAPTTSFSELGAFTF